ncbi:MAG: carboxymuconolactone decarboxylase family protein [bacterium]|nr:carboxymuconolactone decarboxylase family protein [bacterium]
MKKIDLPAFESLSEEVKRKLDTMPKINVFKHLAILQKSFIPIMNIFDSFYSDESKIPPKLREIGILRVGRNTSSSYEVHHHNFVSKCNGVTDKEKDYILIEKKVNQLSELENLICKVADEFCSNFCLSDKTQEKLFSLVPLETAYELIFCFSIYIGLACYIKGTGVLIEDSNPLEGKKTPL